MAEKPKGNIIYEILIVILVVALLGTILYPSRVWRDEEEAERVCRSRMQAIQMMEYHYQGAMNMYTSDVPELVTHILSNRMAISALDTVIMWDDLVRLDDLEGIVAERTFPDELRSHIQEKMMNEEQLGNLAVWDSLGYRLIDRLKQVVEESMEPGNENLDNGIIWPVLTGETRFWSLLDNPEVSRSIRRSTVALVRRGTPVQETRGWRSYYPLFYRQLLEIIQTSERQDIYTPEQKDNWEEDVRQEWETEKDALPDSAKDALWQASQQRFWDKEKELLWKRDRVALWKEEGPEWTEENESTWDRIISQQWVTERKKTWEEEQRVLVPDSLLTTFESERDSLWRVVVDSIQNEEYDTWKEGRKKHVQETVQSVWERERRVTWEDEARETWIEDREADTAQLWEDLKEDMWSLDLGQLWRIEEEKVGARNSAFKGLIQSVNWKMVLGEDQIQPLINGLELPTNDVLWKKIVKMMEDQATVIADLGLIGLFRQTLLDSVAKCPVANVPYMIEVVDTSAIRQFAIECPIVDTERDRYALLLVPGSVDTTMTDMEDTGDVPMDTVRVDLELPGTRKLFGGGTIKNHGNIDLEGRRSWETRSR